MKAYTPDFSGQLGLLAPALISTARDPQQSLRNISGMNELRRREGEKLQKLEQQERERKYKDR